MSSIAEPNKSGLPLDNTREVGHTTERASASNQTDSTLMSGHMNRLDGGWSTAALEVEDTFNRLTDIIPFRSGLFWGRTQGEMVNNGFGAQRFGRGAMTPAHMEAGFYEYDNRDAISSTDMSRRLAWERDNQRYREFTLAPVFQASSSEQHESRFGGGSIAAAHQEAAPGERDNRVKPADLDSSEELSWEVDIRRFLEKWSPGNESADEVD